MNSIRRLPATLDHIDTTRPRYRLAYWCAAVALTLAVFTPFIASFNWEVERLTVASMLDGTAHRPFVYRALVPAAARLLTLALPLGERAAVALLIYLSLLGFVPALRWLYRAFWAPSAYLDLGVLLGVVALAPLMLAYRHMADMTTLLLATVCLALMAYERWTAYLAVFLVSCVNRETTALLALVCLAAYWDRYPWRRLAPLLAAQAVIWLCVRAALVWRFRMNPGEAAELNLGLQLGVLALLPVESLTHILFGAAVLMLVAHRWREKPLFLRRAALVLWPTLVLLYMVLGNPYELRVFYEAFPAVYLLSIPPRGGGG